MQDLGSPVATQWDPTASRSSVSGGPCRECSSPECRSHRLIDWRCCYGRAQPAEDVSTERVSTERELCQLSILVQGRP